MIGDRVNIVGNLASVGKGMNSAKGKEEGRKGKKMEIRLHLTDEKEEIEVKGEDEKELFTIYVTRDFVSVFPARGSKLKVNRVSHETYVGVWIDKEK